MSRRASRSSGVTTPSLPPPRPRRTSDTGPPATTSGARTNSGFQDSATAARRRPGSRPRRPRCAATPCPSRRPDLARGPDHPTLITPRIRHDRRVPVARAEGTFDPFDVLGRHPRRQLVNFAAAQAEGHAPTGYRQPAAASSKSTSHDRPGAGLEEAPLGKPRDHPARTPNNGARTRSTTSDSFPRRCGTRPGRRTRYRSSCSRRPLRARPPPRTRFCCRRPSARHHVHDAFLCASSIAFRTRSLASSQRVWTYVLRHSSGLLPIWSAMSKADTRVATALGAGAQAALASR